MRTVSSDQSENSHSNSGGRNPKLKRWYFLIALAVISYFSISFVAIQPIGAVPDGVTLVMLKGNGMNFIDSADSMCARRLGGVSLLCRGMALGAIGKNGTILLRLPYFDFLYLISTGGERYDRKPAAN